MTNAHVTKSSATSSRAAMFIQESTTQCEHTSNNVCSQIQMHPSHHLLLVDDGSFHNVAIMVIIINILLLLIHFVPSHMPRRLPPLSKPKQMNENSSSDEQLQHILRDVTRQLAAWRPRFEQTTFLVALAGSKQPVRLPVAAPDTVAT